MKGVSAFNTPVLLGLDEEHAHVTYFVPISTANILTRG